MAFKMKGPSLLKMVKKSAMKMAAPEIDPTTGKVIRKKRKPEPKPEPKPRPKPEAKDLKPGKDVLIVKKKKSPTKLKLD